MPSKMETVRPFTITAQPTISKGNPASRAGSWSCSYLRSPEGVTGGPSSRFSTVSPLFLRVTRQPPRDWGRKGVGSVGKDWGVEASATTDSRELRAERMQQRFEWPVVVGALLTVPILVIQESDFGEPWGTVATILNWSTWVVFFLEAVVMLSVVPDRRRWLRHHLVDVAVVIVTPPFAPQAWQNGRLFRLIRLLRLVRVSALRRLLSPRGHEVRGGGCRWPGSRRRRRLRQCRRIERTRCDHDLGRHLVGDHHRHDGRLRRYLPRK